jgi:hypothetical protein
VTWDTISGHFVTDIGENADIGGGNNPDVTVAQGRRQPPRRHLSWFKFA